jgi:hypothetical protein
MPARHVFRPVGKPGEVYPAWLAPFRNASGVYLIKVDRRLVYIGESHTGNLLRTLTRHFSTWKRSKLWWAGLNRGHGEEPGATYPRARCTVAVEVTAPDAAPLREAELIARLAPRDNVRLAVDLPRGAAVAIGSEVPF